MSKVIRANKFNTNFWVKFNGVKIENVSLIDGFSLQVNYNLIQLVNRDGYILDKNKSLQPIPQKIVFYTDDLNKFDRVFKLGVETDIYFNNEIFFYRGFATGISHTKFKHNYYEVVVSLLLQPYSFKKEQEIVLRSNGVIDNLGDYEVKPVVSITPASSNFSLSINGNTMRFKTDSYVPVEFYVDMENYEIKDNGGRLRNSVFIGGNFLDLRSGVNSIVLNDIHIAKFKVNWRYMFYDIFRKK